VGVGVNNVIRFDLVLRANAVIRVNVAIRINRMIRVNLVIRVNGYSGRLLHPLGERTSDHEPQGRVIQVLNNRRKAHKTSPLAVLVVNALVFSCVASLKIVDSGANNRTGSISTSSIKVGKYKGA
jgi:hypothetical protein